MIGEMFTNVIDFLELFGVALLFGFTPLWFHLYRLSVRRRSESDNPMRPGSFAAAILLSLALTVLLLMVRVLVGMFSSW